MVPKKEFLEKGILMVPLFLAFLWMGFLVFNVQSPETGMKLAPSKLDSLVNALFAFIIVYAIVLIALFFRMNKKVHSELDKKPKKAKPKNKK